MSMLGIIPTGNNNASNLPQMVIVPAMYTGTTIVRFTYNVMIAP